MISPEEKIAVVGSGSWGTAFANALSHKGLKVTLWSRRQDLAISIHEKHENSAYLPGVFLSPRLRATHNLEAAIDGAGVVVVAVPSHGFRRTLVSLAPLLSARTPVVSLTKGLEPGTLCRMSEVIAQEVPAAWPSRVAAVSGPNLAKEIALGYPAASVVASADPALADQLQELFLSPVFRTYSDSDIIGVELGGAVKNVIGIATGIAEGCGFGDNAKASVMTRGLVEMTRLGLSCGADRLTFSGLAGVGDLICTCMSRLSRNHTVGVRLGEGVKIEKITAGMSEVAEGIESSRAVKILAERQGVSMPIALGVYRVIHENQDVSEMVADLLRAVRQRERD